VLGRPEVHLARNGEIIRLAFIIDAFDREIIAWTAVANTGISGSDVRDMMLEAVEKRALVPASTAVPAASANGRAAAPTQTCLVFRPVRDLEFHLAGYDGGGRKCG